MITLRAAIAAQGRRRKKGAPSGITYVGGITGNWVGATSGTNTVSINGTLTGGLAASPSAGDLILALYTTGSVADRALTITDGTIDYTLIDAELYSDGSSYDSNLRLAYKFRVADTDVTFGPTGNASDGGAAVIHVWRGVNAVTPLDVAAVPATGTGGPQPNAGPITPVTAGAIIIVACGGASSNGTTFTASELSNFRTDFGNDTNDGIAGMGSKSWTTGEFNPAAWTGGGSGGGASWTAMTVALRPA